jgi:pantothenate kinase type III
MKILTGDLGNSRLKLRLWSAEEGRAPVRLGTLDLAAAPGLGAAVAVRLAELGRFEAAVIASVARAEIEAEFDRALLEVGGPVAGSRRAPPSDAGLRILCREPEKVGRDRLFSARGALELAPGGAIVVDAGTALTVDAVRADRAFLGGAIAPGPALLARALAEGTARLPAVEPAPTRAALGRDTREAILAGVVLGFRGAARELADRAAEESGIEAPTLVLTGGARGFLLDPPAFGTRVVVVEEDLVHLGLLSAFLAPAEAGRARR